MDVKYFIKELHWMSAFGEATLKILLVEVNLPQSWPLKQNGTLVVATMMILEVVKSCRSMLQTNIFLKKIDFEP